MNTFEFQVYQIFSSIQINIASYLSENLLIIILYFTIISLIQIFITTSCKKDICIPV